MSSGPTYIGGKTGQIPVPELPASPDIDDVVDALLAIGAVTQAET